MGSGKLSRDRHVFMVSPELASKRMSNTCASGKNAIPHEPQDKAFWSLSRSAWPSPPDCTKSYKY